MERKPIKKTCTICGEDFYTTDNRRNYCPKCSALSDTDKKNAYLRRYVKARRRNDPEYAAKLIARNTINARNRRRVIYTERAKEIIHNNFNLEELVEYLENNFKIKHKEGK